MATSPALVLGFLVLALAQSGLGLEILKYGALPTPRSHTAAVYDGGNSVYILGGVGADGTRLTEILKYNLADGTGTVFGNFPVGVSHGAAAMVGTGNGDIYYFGGGNINGDIYEDAIYKVTINEDGTFGAVETLEATMEQPLAGMTAHFIPTQNAIFLFGGQNTVASKNITKFTETTQEVVGSLPFPLTRGSSVLRGDLVYVFGGWNYEDENGHHILSHEIFEFNPTTDPAQVDWVNATLVQGAESAVAVQVGEFSYVIGGFGGGDWPNQRLTEFNTDTDEIKEICVAEELKFLPQYASGIYAGGSEGGPMEPHHNRIYVFGGYTDEAVSAVLVIPVGSMVKDPCPPKKDNNSAMNIQQSTSLLLVVLVVIIQQAIF